MGYHFSILRSPSTPILAEEEVAQLSRKLAGEQRRRDWIARIAPLGAFMLIGWLYARFIK